MKRVQTSDVWVRVHGETEGRAKPEARGSRRPRGGYRRGDREDQGDDRLRARCAPGDRLPKESELAAELGLSRNSLREAVRALSLIRILDVRQGDGTYVTSLDPQLLLEA